MLLMKQLRRRQLSRRAVDAVLSARTKTVNFESSPRETNPLVAAELRGIDTDRRSVVSAIVKVELRTAETFCLKMHIIFFRNICIFP